ncbi:unnamed protein product [Symbiodinium natans]|uniref:Uncharacterized protein n=1 Tax=Symbiodinium natans TaxID=878477 RepID=A0A812QQ58_9DINO|nr:unnamed protein product [Symbiodinium natans]
MRRSASVLGAIGLAGAAAASEDSISCDSGERFRLLEPLRGVASPGSCSWQPVEGASFLPGYAGGAPVAAGSLATAKAHCELLGSSCSGITWQPCRWNSVMLYSLREEAEPKVSPQGEISWLKLCGAVESGDDGWQEPPGPPGVEQCAEGFQALRVAAEEFYDSGVVNVNLLINMGNVLRAAASSGGWHHIAAHCVPAVLQTLLLRLEERFFIDHTEQSSLEETYFDILHHLLSIGDSHVVVAETARWPLRRGWNRIQGLRRRLQSPVETGEGQSVDFVLCFCSVARSPGGGYPAVEDELGWLAELLAPEADLHRNSTRIYVKEKCGDAAAPGAEESLRPALLPFAHVVEVVRVDDELRADDATAYLHHLAGSNYDDLAAWTFFLHADAPEHVHPFRLLEEVLAAARSGMLQEDTFPFLYLSHNYLDLGTSLHTWDNFASPRLWRRIFGSTLAPPREAVKGYCCVQFLVPRRRALLRAREWYAAALSYFASAASYFDLFPWSRLVTWQDLTCRTPAQLWMPWWHVVFGEELACPERHQDPRLPLFVQLRSIPPDRIHCC